MTTEQHQPTQDGLLALQTHGKAFVTPSKTYEPDEAGLIHISISDLMNLHGFSIPIETHQLMKDQPSYFGGRLIRFPDGSFTWFNGERETRVLIRTLDHHYDFNEADSEVQVPVKLAKTEEDLSWVLNGGFEESDASDYDARYRERFSPDPFSRKLLPGEKTPRVFLVPKKEWARQASACLGITWKSDDEWAILQKAKTLGWNEEDV